MRPALTFALVACLIASPVQLFAQVPAGSSAPGPIARSLTREAARLVAAAQAAPASPAPAPAGGAPVEMKWSELGPIVVNQHVDVALKDGRTVRGDALAVRDTELLLNAKSDPKGSMTIPRESVTGLTVTRTKGAGGRTFGTIVGAVGGMYLFGYAASKTDSAAVGLPLFFGGSIALGTVGYYAGRSADTQKTRITIIN